MQFDEGCVDRPGWGSPLAGQIIWDKGLFSVGRSWYHWAHEPCVIVRRPGVPHLFIGERDQSTIWRAPSPKRIGGGSKERREDHPTQKEALRALDRDLDVLGVDLHREAAPPEGIGRHEGRARTTRRTAEPGIRMA